MARFWSSQTWVMPTFSPTMALVATCPLPVSLFGLRRVRRAPKYPCARQRSARETRAERSKWFGVRSRRGPAITHVCCAAAAPGHRSKSPPSSRIRRLARLHHGAAPCRAAGAEGVGGPSWAGSPSPGGESPSAAQRPRLLKFGETRRDGELNSGRKEREALRDPDESRSGQSSTSERAPADPATSRRGTATRTPEGGARPPPKRSGS